MALHQMVITTNTENGLRLEAALLYLGETKETGESTLDFVHRCVCKNLREQVRASEAAQAAAAVVVDEDVVN